MNIRHIGTYEIVVCNANKNRIKEVVCDTNLIDADEIASGLLETVPGACSTYVSRVIRNSLFNPHAPKQNKGGQP